MGIMDKFSEGDVGVRPTLTVTFDAEAIRRVNDAAFALKTKGCKSRGEFARKALLEAVDEVEKGFGGREAVVAAANSVDPQGERHKTKKKSNGATQASVDQTPEKKAKK